MVSTTTPANPEYLVSSPALIKALKAANDPPQSGWPSKIEIALQAWNLDDEKSPLFRKGEIIRDWIIESWSQYKVVNGKLELAFPGKGKGKRTHNPLLDQRYADLLLRLFQSNPSLNPSSAQGKASATTNAVPNFQPIISAFVTSLTERLSSVDDVTPSSLLTSYYAVFTTMLKGKTPSDGATTLLDLLNKTNKLDVVGAAGKAEGWLETFGILLKCLKVVGQKEGDAGVESLRGILYLILEELIVGLNVSLNRKKITQNLMPAVMPDFLESWPTSTPLHEPLRFVLRDLLFPVDILQTSTPIDLILQLPFPDSRLLLDFLPEILSAFITSLQRQRYSVFPMTSAALSLTRQKNIPPEIYVSGRVRDAVLQALISILQAIQELDSEDHAWSAKLSVWKVIQQWGGYFEGDAKWSSLFLQTVQDASAVLREKEDSTVLALMNVLASIDIYNLQKDQESLKEAILPRFLLARKEDSAIVESMWLQILEYYTLTQDIVTFLGILTETIQFMSEASASDARTYVSCATNPLFQNAMTAAMRRSFRLSLAAGINPERGWGLAVINLDNSLSALSSSVSQIESEESPSKKRRANSGPVKTSSTTSAASLSFALLSRLMYILLGAAIDDNGDLGVKSRQKAIEDVLVQLKEPVQCPGNALVEPSQSRIVRQVRRLGRTDYGLSLIPSTDSQEQAFESAQNAIVADDHTLSDGWLKSASTAAGGWTGQLACLNSQNVGSAFSQLWLERGMLFIHEKATDEQIDQIASCILRNQNQAPNVSEYRAETSFSLWVRSADFWELPRYQKSIMEIIERKDASEVARHTVFTFAALAPADYLSKRIRNMLVEEAYQKNDNWKPEEQAVIQSFLLQVAQQTSYLGPLATDITALESLIKRSVDGGEKAYELLRLAFRSLLAQMRSSDGHLIMLMQLALNLSKTKLANAQAELSASVILLDEYSQMKAEAKELPAQLLRTLDGVSKAVSKALAKKGTDAQSSAKDKASAIRCWTVIRSYQVWRSSADDLDLTLPEWREVVKDTLLTLHDHAANNNEANNLVAATLDFTGVVLNPSSKPMDAQVWLATWTLLIAQISRPLVNVLDPVFNKTLQAISPDCYDVILQTIIDSLVSIQPTHAIPTLQAAGLLLSLNVPGVGKFLASRLGDLLVRLKSFVSSRPSTPILLAALELASIITTEKATSLHAQDLTSVLSITHSALLPAEKRDSHDEQTTPAVLRVVLKIVNTLARHRRDLVVHQLPLVVATLAKILPLLTQPRPTVTSMRLRETIISSWPSWMAMGGEALGVSEARELARVMVTLTSRTTVRSHAKDSASVGTMVGQLSKHAPVLLMAYVRAVAHPYGMVPAEVRNALEPGLLALCETIHAGGKAQFGMLGGQGVGDAFGLGEGDSETREAEVEVWAELWRKWQSKRYTGQG